MILGNSMTSAALAGDRLQGDLRARADEVEARLALGFSGQEAVQPMVRAALRVAMIPTVKGMMTVGLVQLPGMMTGHDPGWFFPTAGDPLPDRRRATATSAPKRMWSRRTSSTGSTGHMLGCASDNADHRRTHRELGLSVCRCASVRMPPHPGEGLPLFSVDRRVSDVARRLPQSPVK
jgi:hypothetical protein